MRRFPLSLFIYPKLCSFAPAPKNAVHFLYGAVLHRPAFWPPLQSVFAKDTAFFSAKAQKLQNSACAEFLDGLPDFLWRNLVGVSSHRTGCVLNREGLCVKELNLLLQLPQDVSTRYRSVDMTVLAAFATLVCQKNSVFL